MKASILEQRRLRMRGGRILAAFIVVVLLPSVGARALQSVCPEGMVLGGMRCEWREVCPDGKPSLGNDCSPSGPVLPLPTPSPAPPGAERCPDGSPKVKGKCQAITIPVCPQGRSALNGSCVGVERHCEKKAIFNPVLGKREEDRRILLVGGEAAKLLDRYFSDAKRGKLDIDRKTLVVVFYDKRGQRVKLQGGTDVVMSLGQFFSGLTFDQLWRKTLKGKMARDINDPAVVAKRLEADLICGDASD